MTKREKTLRFEAAQYLKKHFGLLIPAKTWEDVLKVEDYVIKNIFHKDYEDKILTTKSLIIGEVDNGE